MNKYFLMLIVFVTVATAVSAYYFSTVQQNLFDVVSTNAPSTRSIADIVIPPTQVPKPTVTSGQISTSQDSEQIKQAMAQIYKKPADSITLSVDKNTGIYASGSVKIGQEASGGWFLAVKIKDVWRIVTEGNGSIMCDRLTGYDFPADMVPECWDKTSKQLIKR